MYRQPLLILCICFILGIFFQETVHLSGKFSWILTLISFAALFLFISRSFYIQKFRFYLLWIFFFSLGNLAHLINNKEPELPKLGSRAIITFKISKKLNSNLKNRRYEVAILNLEGKSQPFFPVNAVLSLPKTESDFDFVHYYRSEAYLKKIESPKNTFSFDYHKYLARKNIFFQAYLPNSYRSAERNDLSFAEKIRQKRLEVLQKIDAAHLPPNIREFTKGIILADRTEMDAQTVQDFSRSGLVHILAISGSHMAILFWLLLLILKPVFPTKRRNLQVIIALLLIWAFGVFIDYGSSVVRSCIMITVYYIYILLQRKPDLLHAMALSAFIILVFDTNQVFDVGFQLSYVAVFGIFWLNGPILRFLPKPKNNFQKFLVNVPSISLAAQLATLPLVVYYFHQYSLISVPANLVVIPFSEAIIIFSLLMSILLAFSIEFTVLNMVYVFVVSLLLKTIHFFGNSDVAFMKNIPMELAEVVLLFAGLYFMRDVLEKVTLKRVVRILALFVGFVFLRFGLQVYHLQKDEVLIHEYFQEKIISVKEKDRTVFYIRENADTAQIRKYVVDPYLIFRRVKEAEIKKLPRNADRVIIEGKTYYLNENQSD